MEAEETVSAAAAAAPSAARLSVTLHAHEPPAGAGAAGGAGGKRRLPPLEVFGPTDGLSPTLRASSVGSGSASPSIPSDPGELRAAYLRLLKEHGDLREHAHNLEAQVGVYRSPRMAGIAAAHGPLARKVSKLDSGAVVRLTEAELASMRQVFALFDPHGSGTISAGELQVRGGALARSTRRSVRVPSVRCGACRPDARCVASPPSPGLRPPPAPRRTCTASWASR